MTTKALIPAYFPFTGVSALLQISCHSAGNNVIANEGKNYTKFPC